MSIYTDLLFLSGHIGNIDLARSLASPDAQNPDQPAPQPASQPDAPAEAATSAASAAFYRPRSWRYPLRLFQALIPLDESPAATARLGVGDLPFEPAYGNRLAWQRRFPGYGSAGRVAPRQSRQPCQACPA